MSDIIQPAAPVKIAIVGTCDTSRDLAPWQDDSWLKWVCSEKNSTVPCADAWFELHALDDINVAEQKPWINWLRKQQFPIYMQDKNALVPQALKFPADEVVAAFGDFGSDFMTSTIAWMLAWAIITPGVVEIAIYGVDMAHDSEYAYQRPGMRYFINEARRRGIKVTIPPQSDLDTPTPLYGYSMASPHAQKFKTRRAELEAMIAKLRGVVAQADETKRVCEVELAKFMGALENQKWIERTYS